MQLADELARRTPPGLAIVGKTETENIGIDKLIKNVISSSTLRYLILAGTESDGHLVGQTLLALAAGLSGCGPPSSPTVFVSAAASLTDAFEEIETLMSIKKP